MRQQDAVLGGFGCVGAQHAVEVRQDGVELADRITHRALDRHPVGQPGSADHRDPVVGTEYPGEVAHQQGEQRYRCLGFARLAGPVGELAAGEQGLAVVGAEDTAQVRHHGVEQLPGLVPAACCS